MDGLIALVRENAVVVLLVLFLGVLYWAFRPRFRRRRGKDDNTPGNPGGNWTAIGSRFLPIVQCNIIC